MDSLSPSKTRKLTKSDHPKTVANRKLIEAKTGLEKVEYRVNTAFRVAKSRELKKLHSAPGWERKSAFDKQLAESRVVTKLARIRDERIRAAEIESLVKHEQGDSDDEDELMEDMKPPIEEAESAADDTVMEDAGLSSGEEIIVTDNEEGNDEWVTDDEDVTAALHEMKTASGVKFWEQMREWETKATAAEREFKAALGS
jgi:hypothetical protein